MTALPREALSELLRDGIRAVPAVPAAVVEPLLDYLTLLHRWNAAYNLSAIREPRPMVTRHLLDSLVVLPHVRGGSLLDVGSGAGLPGLPLALCRPELAVTVLDGNGKKTRFLRQAVAELRLSNVTVVHSRIQDYRPVARFDCIVSRAYSRFDAYAAQAAPLLAPGGCLLAMKGRFNPREEAPGLVDSLEVLALSMPGLDEERSLVRLEAAALRHGNTS